MNPRIQILMLTPRYFPAIGGVEKHVQILSKKLMDSGFEVTLLTTKHMKNLASLERHKGIRIIRIPYGLDKNPLLVYAWMIRNRKSILNYNVIHIHDMMPLLTWYFPLRILHPTRKVYATFHGYERDPVPIIFRVLRKFAMLLVKSSLCIGRFIEKIYGVKCTKSSVGAVNVEEASNKPKNGVLYIGRMEEDVGIDEYIKAVHLFEKNTGKRLKFTFCGSGSKENEIRNLADSLGIDHDFRGVVSNPNEILDSREVCFAGGYLSILEANAMGIPVIAMANTYLKYQYYKGMREEGAIISIQTTVEGIVRELTRLQNDSTLTESIVNAGRSFAKRMSWDYLMREYKTLWCLSH